MINRNLDLELEDFELEETRTSYRPKFLDPGRKSVLTAAVGKNTGEHQIRGCSTKVYYHLTGSTQLLKRQQKSKR